MMPEKPTEANKPLPHWSDHWQTSEVVCPWCGDTWTDSWEDAGCEDDMYDDVECDECGRRFTWRCDVKVTYTTRRIEDEDGNGSAAPND